MSGSTTSLPEKKKAPSPLIMKDRDDEFKTTEGLIGTAHQPAKEDNVANRGPGQTMP